MATETAVSVKIDTEAGAATSAWVAAKSNASSSSMRSSMSILISLVSLSASSCWT